MKHFKSYVGSDNDTPIQNNKNINESLIFGMAFLAIAFAYQVSAAADSKGKGKGDGGGPGFFSALFGKIFRKNEKDLSEKEKQKNENLMTSMYGEKGDLNSPEETLKKLRSTFDSDDEYDKFLEGQKKIANEEKNLKQLQEAAKAMTPTEMAQEESKNQLNTINLHKQKKLEELEKELEEKSKDETDEVKLAGLKALHKEAVEKVENETKEALTNKAKERDEIESQALAQEKQQKLIEAGDNEESKKKVEEEYTKKEEELKKSHEQRSKDISEDKYVSGLDATKVLALSPADDGKDKDGDNKDDDGKDKDGDNKDDDNKDDDGKGKDDDNKDDDGKDKDDDGKGKDDDNKDDDNKDDDNKDDDGKGKGSDPREIWKKVKSKRKGGKPHYVNKNNPDSTISFKEFQKLMKNYQTRMAKNKPTTPKESFTAVFTGMIMEQYVPSLSDYLIGLFEE